MYLRRWIVSVFSVFLLLLASAEATATTTISSPVRHDAAIQPLTVPGSAAGGIAFNPSTLYLTWHAGAVGWAKGTIKISWRLKANGVTVTSGDKTCSSTTQCWKPSALIYCPVPGYWQLYVTATGPGGSDDWYGSTTVVY